MKYILLVLLVSCVATPPKVETIPFVMSALIDGKWGDFKVPTNEKCMSWGKSLVDKKIATRVICFSNMPAKNFQH